MTNASPFTVVIYQDGETARLDCTTYEEAVIVYRSFVNYGKCQEVRIEKNSLPA